MKFWNPHLVTTQNISSFFLFLCQSLCCASFIESLKIGVHNWGGLLIHWGEELVSVLYVLSLNYLLVSALKLPVLPANMTLSIGTGNDSLFLIFATESKGWRVNKYQHHSFCTSSLLRNIFPSLPADASQESWMSCWSCGSGSPVLLPQYAHPSNSSGDIGGSPHIVTGS